MTISALFDKQDFGGVSGKNGQATYLFASPLIPVIPGCPDTKTEGASSANILSRQNSCVIPPNPGVFGSARATLFDAAVAPYSMEAYLSILNDVVSSAQADRINVLTSQGFQRVSAQNFRISSVVDNIERITTVSVTGDKVLNDICGLPVGYTSSASMVTNAYDLTTCELTPVSIYKVSAGFNTTELIDDAARAEAIIALKIISNLAQLENFIGGASAVVSAEAIQLGETVVIAP
jgi:hypothetical protein